MICGLAEISVCAFAPFNGLGKTDGRISINVGVSSDDRVVSRTLPTQYSKVLFEIPKALAKAPADIVPRCHSSTLAIIYSLFCFDILPILLDKGRLGISRKKDGVNGVHTIEM